MIPSVQKQVDQIKALGAPAGDEDRSTRSSTDAQAATDKIKADPSLVAANGSNDPFAKANQEATAYGLKECGAG